MSRDSKQSPKRPGARKTNQDTTKKPSSKKILRDSEERYRTILNSIDEGFCVVEMLFDEQDRPVDYRFLEVNAAFEKQAGITDVVGRRMREIATRHEEHWFEIYGQVALTGEAIRFQNSAESLNRVYNVYAFRVDEPEMRHVAILFNDISDKQQVEEQLQSAALFPEENPFPILRIDGNGTLRYANRAAADLLTQWQIDIGGPVPDSISYEVTAALATGAPLEIEIRCNERDLSLILVPIVERGYVNFYGRDVTKRKKAEEALRESEQRYRDLFHHNHAVMLLIDPQDGRIIDANSAACRFYGYSLEEIANLNITAINTLSRDQIRVDMQKAVSTQRRHFFFRHRLANGQMRDVEVYSGPLLIKGRELLYSIVHDITDRKRIETALRESEQRFTSFMLHLPAATWLKDLLGRYLYANVETERIFSLPLSALQGKSDEDFLPPEAARQFRESDQRVLSEGGSLQATQVVCEPDGTDHHFLTKKFIVPDSNGQPAYIAGVAFDITDLKRAELEISRLNADLEARAEELEKANEELEAFNYMVAHDLRKPLTVINGYSQIIQKFCGDKLDQQCTGYLSTICDCTLKMSQLIDSLLNFSNLDHAELHMETVNLSVLVQNVATDFKLTNPERQVTFRVAEEISVKGDAGLLRVVMDNLIGNAWKYSANREEATIEFGTAEFDGKTTCFIRDNGIGFAMEDAEKLFMPFQRFPGTENIMGFGIGLATVERIIHRHGGKIWAEAKPGEGATFFFTLR